MANILEEFQKECAKLAWQKGEQNGIVIGEQRGIAIGEQRGEQKGRRETMFTLVRDGNLAVAAAASYLKMSVDAFLSAMAEAGYKTLE